MTKKPFCSELAYLLSIICMAFAVSMTVSASFGISMIVAPAYIVSEKLTFLTFGQAEYIVQGILFIIFCIIVKKVKPVFLMAFATCIVYGLCLDLIQTIIPIFNPSITPPESIDLWLRIVLFVCGVVLTSFAVALSFKTYLYAQVYDFFVKETSLHFNLELGKFKTIFDFSFLAIAVILSLIFFGRVIAIGWGTLVMVLVNGFLISSFSKLFDKIFTPKPILKGFSKFFEQSTEQ